LAKAGDFSLVHSFLTGSGAHPASCQVLVALSLGVRQRHSSPSYAKVIDMVTSLMIWGIQMGDISRLGWLRGLFKHHMG
jgi:hypothetical protein